MTLPPIVRKALHSERVWIATVLLVAAVAFYVLGLITAEVLITSISIIAGIYIGAVTVKDGFASLLTAWIRAERYMQPDARPRVDDSDPQTKQPPAGRMDIYR